MYYLIAYEYSYNENPTTFTTVVEAENYKDAEINFKKKNITATIIDMRTLPNDPTCCWCAGQECPCVCNVNCKKGKCNC